MRSGCLLPLSFTALVAAGSAVAEAPPAVIDPIETVLRCVDPAQGRSSRPECPAALAALGGEETDLRLAGALVIESLADRSPAPEDVLARVLVQHLDDEPLAITIMSALRRQRADGATTRDALSRAVAQGSPLVARAAASRLAALRDGDESVAALLDRLRWRGHEWHRTTFPLARRLGGAAIAPLAALARDARETVSARSAALFVLRDLGPAASAALPDVRACVGDDKVAALAVSALAALGPEGRVEVERLLDVSLGSNGRRGVIDTFAADTAGLDLLARRLATADRGAREAMLRALVGRELPESPALTRAVAAMVEPPATVDDLEWYLGPRGIACGSGGVAAMPLDALAVGTLAGIAGAVPALASMLTEPGDTLAPHAAWALLLLGERATDATAHGALRATRRDDVAILRLAVLLTRGSMRTSLDGASPDDRDSEMRRHARELDRVAGARLGDSDPRVRHAAAVLLAGAWADLEGATSVEASALLEREDDPRSTRAVLRVLRFLQEPSPRAEAAIVELGDVLPGSARSCLPFELRARLPQRAMPSLEHVATLTAPTLPEGLVQRDRQPRSERPELRELPRLLREANDPDPWVSRDALAAYDRLARGRFPWAAWRAHL